MAYIIKPKSSAQAVRTSSPPAPAYYNFAEHTHINWFRIHFKDEKRQFFVNPWIVGQMSPVLEMMFLNEKFIEARNGEVNLPAENPEDILQFLQATVPHGCNPCRPISAATFPLLLHYAKIWLIEGLELQCRRFVRGEFRITATTLEESIGMLEAACDNKFNDKTTLAVLIGRCAAFGTEALLNAEVLESTKLTPYASGLLFLYAERKSHSATANRMARGSSTSGRTPMPHAWQSGPGGKCGFCDRPGTSLSHCTTCTVAACARCAQHQTRNDFGCKKTMEIIPIVECETEEGKTEAQAAETRRQRENGFLKDPVFFGSVFDEYYGSGDD